MSRGMETPAAEGDWKEKGSEVKYQVISTDDQRA